MRDPTSGAPKPWLVLAEWVDEDWGIVRLEWVAGTFVLWEQFSSEHIRKIPESWHPDIFRRRSVSWDSAYYVSLKEARARELAGRTEGGS